jgi:mono/diheme cytochrome c family protein
VVCHTSKDGTAFAGGLAFVLPFGTIYSTNITPDAETGIGSYTDADFLNAVHKGIGRGNTKLYPAMPYTSYTYMSDADALAIKAYLFTLKPVHAPAPKNTLAFPFNQRGLMSMWSVLFNSDKRFEPHVDRSAEWNRGAYLAEAMAHCGECHTPRNLFFALNNRQKFAGTVQAGWRAYNITADRGSGVGAWSDADLANYLSAGHADGRGTASGPMGEAVDESLSHLQPSDIGHGGLFTLSAGRCHVRPAGTQVYARGDCASRRHRRKPAWQGSLRRRLRRVPRLDRCESGSSVRDADRHAFGQ